MPKILAFAGSLRAGSFNKMLAREAARFAREAGAEVTELDLRDYPVPLYDGDLEREEGLPAEVRTLQRLFADHDGFLIASPEYNGMFSGVLKNYIDWLSRPGDASPFAGKTAVMLAASPGGWGGIRALPHLRILLSTIGINVLARQLAVPRAGQVFDAEGRIADEGVKKQVQELAALLVDHLAERVAA